MKISLLKSAKNSSVSVTHFLDLVLEKCSYFDIVSICIDAILMLFAKFIADSYTLL